MEGADGLETGRRRVIRPSPPRSVVPASRTPRSAFGSDRWRASAIAETPPHRRETLSFNTAMTPRYFEATVEAAFLVANADGLFDDEERSAFQHVVLQACNHLVADDLIQSLFSCIGLVSMVAWYRLMKVFHCSFRVWNRYPPRIFSEAHHGTEASRALTVGARTKPPVRPTSGPAPVRCCFGSERTCGASGSDRGFNLGSSAKSVGNFGPIFRFPVACT